MVIKVKSEKGLTFIAMIFIVILIALLVFGVVYFTRIQVSNEKLETLKTNMLLIQAKTNVIAQDVEMKVENATLKGTKLADMKEDEIIKSFLEKGVIDENSEDSDFYVLKDQDIKDLGLENVEIEDGSYYIVDYKKNDIITTNGFEASDKNMYYKLSELENLNNE